MIQNDNRSECEIIHSGIGYDSPKYPLATDPGSNLQNMSYKDWMRMCADGTVLSSSSSSVRDAVITGTAIVSTLVGISFPIAGAAIGILSSILPFLWPEDAGAPGTIQAQFTWNQLMNAVEELIDEKILDLVRRDAIATLQKLQSSVRDYQQAICNLKRDPNNELYKADVRREFNDAEDQAKFAIIDLKKQGYEIPLLASYAQAANLHLLLLRDVVRNGISWGFSPLEVQQYYNNGSVAKFEKT
ncbi:hypothetical protein A9498_30930 (plasmid) [Bacillus thuringiensis serovar coreanensis]|nr:hypothetical protein A9498_30930 [Bacillus thuringiensis serovar coreanensis]